MCAFEIILLYGSYSKKGKKDLLPSNAHWKTAQDWLEETGNVYCYIAFKC